jgi:hypothetical protein
VNVRRRWTLAWAGGTVLGIVNAIAREARLKKRVGDRAADVISAASLAALLAGYFVLLQRRWPIPTRREAVSIGATWAALTVTFEFGFGHYVDGKPWRQLVDNYDVSEGRLWPFVLTWVGAGPALIREISRFAGRYGRRLA